MKYIINVPEDRVQGDRLCVMGIMEDSLSHYLPTGIKATPYDESEAEQRGQEEAWEFAQKILAPPNNSDALTAEDLADCYGTDDAYDVICEMTYQEACEKYEAWKKEMEEIKIGDEIRNGGVYGIVTLVEKKADGICYHVVGDDGYVWYLNDLVTKKTGRHFPEVADLLEKMRNPDADH